jgi:DNA polymerase-3 subunit gamma/tau
MSEITLYRKYRPTKFGEVLGQEHVVNAIKGAIENENIGHAYLFSGTRGTGKTSLARIFANKIGTSKRDLHEIDAASNRGVEDIRTLREEVHTLPFESKYKVYIIDEAHMLTKEAFNALLKTLEEPPKHVIFILATTEKEKFPDTIVSRCQSFSFKKPTTAILKKMILNVAKKEGYEMEPASAELIALLADGSFRDAHGYLQQVISSSKGKTISREEVESVTGSPKSSQLLTLLKSISEKNTNNAIKTIHEITNSGIDIKTMTTLLLRLARAVLIFRFSPSLKKEIENEFSEEEVNEIKKHAENSKTTINSKLLSLLLEAYNTTGTTHTPELPLELALIEHINTLNKNEK